MVFPVNGSRPEYKELKVTPKRLPDLPFPSFSRLESKRTLAGGESESAVLDSPDMSISHSLGHNGEWGTETLFTHPTYTQHQMIQERQQAYYKHRLNYLILKINKDTAGITVGQHLRRKTPEGQEILRLLHGLKHCRLMLRNGARHAQADPARAEWMSTSFVRNRMVKEGVKAVDSIPSFPVNFRRQVYQNLDHSEEIDFMRLGVFYDPRDPDHTLAELSRYKKDPKALKEAIDRREKELQEYAKKGDTKAVAALKRSLFPLDMLQQGASSYVDALIERKQLFLNDQMLHLILAQLRSNPQVSEGSQFILAHLGLLNEKVRRVDPSGLLLDEGAFMQEMAGTFQRFQGKKLIFDGSGPYIDLQGNIHLDQKLTTQGKPLTLSLETLFANFTVQGSTHNNPVQALLNKEAFQRLQLIIPEGRTDLKRRLLDIRSKLLEGKSNFDLASQFFSLLLDLRKTVNALAISDGCFSAKDRTAVVSEAGITQSGLKPTVKKAYPDQPVKTQSILEELSLRIFDTKWGISGRASKQNVDSSLIKISSFFPPGIGRSVKAVASRIFFYMRQAKDYVGNLLK